MRHLGLLALTLWVCLPCADPAQADTYYWNPGNTVATSLSGNVDVPFGGTSLAINAATTIDPSTVIDLGGPTGPLSMAGDTGEVGDEVGILRLQADVPLPPIDPNSRGVILLDQVDISNPITSIGMAFLGAVDDSWYPHNDYQATTLAPCTDHVYRIGGTGNYGGADAGRSTLYFTTSWLHPGSHGCLSGDNDLLIWNGYAEILDIEDYTGATTISCTNNPRYWSGFPVTAYCQPGGSPLGSNTSAPVKMSAGSLLIANYAYYYQIGDPITKGQLSFESMNYLGVSAGAAAPTWDTTVTFASIQRIGNGMLSIFGNYNLLGNSGGFGERVFATTPPAVNAINGMVAPYMVSCGYDAQTPNFLTYSATYGFGIPTYTAMPASGGAGTEIATSGGTTLTGDVHVYALQAMGAITGAGNTVTIDSGGLIAGAGGTSNANFKFGPSGTGEAVIFIPHQNEQLELSGTITADGLTMGGVGNLLLDGDNRGTLTGTITVNQGTLIFSPNGLGDAGICLNGGFLRSGSDPGAGRSITIGPGGGILEIANYSARISSVISDAPQGGGSVTIRGNYFPAEFDGANTFTGGLIVDNGQLVLNNDGTPGCGNITVEGTASPYGCQINDYSNNAWSTPGRVSLDGPSNYLQLWFEYGPGGQKTWSFGSLEGRGNIAIGGVWGAFNNPTLQVGTDNTSTDFFGSIYENNTWGTNHFNFTKVGTGTLTFWGTNTYTGATAINGGTLRVNGGLGDGVTPGGDVAVNGTGTLDGTGTIHRNVTVNTGGTLAGGLTIDGNLAISGGAGNPAGAVINGGFDLGSGTYAGASTISDTAGYGFEIDGGAFSGTHTIGTVAYVLMWGGSLGGTNTITAPAVYLEGGEFNSSGSVTIAPGAGNGFYINYLGGEGGDVSGTAAIYGDVYVQGHSFSGVHTIVGNVRVGDYNGDGSHPVFSGASNITGNVIVGLSGTFKGGHTIHGSLTTAAGGNAVLAPSNTTTTAETLTVVGDVTLDHSTALNFNLGQVGTTGGGINDLIAITGDLSLDGTLNVAALTNFGPGVYTLITYTGALSGAGLTQGDMPSGLGFTYTIDTGTLHQVNLDVVTPWAPGDTNRDGAVNSLDIDAIFKHFGADATSQWKVATDGLAVGQQDVTYELHAIFHTNYADANMDRKTDFVDFQVLLDHWQASGPSIGWAQGDFDGSGTVDFLDFQKLLDYWNPGGWNFAPAQAPEPASLSLILLGGLALLRRRK